MKKDLTTLPDNLPVPQDDGACNHLTGLRLPSLTLTSHTGHRVDVNALQGTAVIYVFPMMGRPDAPPMIGWNDIPGARGCTPQSCAFRDHYAELQSLNAQVFGVSVQSVDDLQEAAQRLHLPFELLSDESFVFANALRLPTFEYNTRRLIKRLTLIAKDGVIKKVFYPVFPPNKNAEDVIEWLQANKI